MLRDPKARQRLLSLGTSGAKAHLYRDEEKGDEDEAIANWEQKKEEGLLEQPSISDSARNIDMQKFSSSDPRLSNNGIYAENSRTMGNYNPQADKELTGYERFMGYKDKYTQRKEDEETLRKQAKKDADYSAYKNEKASALENMNQEQYEALERYNDRVDFWKARGGAMPTGDRLAEEKQAAIDAGIPEDKVEKYAQYVKEKNNERETNKRNEWVKERLTDDTELNGGVSDALKEMGRLGAGYLASQHPFLGAAANYGLDQLKDKTLTRGDVANMVATPLDILASPVVGMAATETVNKLNYADKRAHVDTNSRAYALQNLSNTIEQTQKENIADTVNNQNWSDTSKNVVTLAAQGAYDLGMTTSKAALSMAIGQVAGMGVAEGIKDTEVAADIIKKVANIITLPSYGTSSYAQTLKEGYDRGLSEGEAQATAFVAGCAEMLTEVFSLDMALDAMNKGGRKLLKEKIADAFAGAAVEGSEEFFNDIINGFADTIINGDKSEYNVEVEELMKQGLSKEDAQKEATINFFKNGAKDFAMGMASGLILQGGASLLGSANTMDEVRMLHQEGNYREIEEGIDTDPNSYADENQVKVAEKAKEMYKKLADKAERGETIKNSEQQSAYELLEETMDYAQQNLTTETQNLENGENMTPQEVENNNTQNIETNEQNITQTARALREAETPQELVKAEREAKAAGLDAGAVAKEVGRVSQQKGFDIEEVRQLEAVPTAEEAKQLGYEGKEAPENLDLAGKKAYNEGKAQALKEVQSAKIEKPLNQAKATLDGEEITIKGLTKNNEFITDKGNIPANKVTFNDKTTEYLYQSALKYEGNVRDAFIENYSPKITAGAYVTAFESLYNAGSLNKKWGAYAKRHSFLVEQLGEDAARTIYDFAMMENIESRIKNRGKKNAKMSSGSVKDLRKNVPESGDALFETAEILAKKLGIDIVLGADTGKANGEFNGNTIFVKDGTGVELRTLYHEMGEFIKAYEKQGFDDLRSSIIEWFNKYDENGFDALVKNYYETYKAHYEMLNEKYGTDRSITMGEASDEAIFDALVNICLDEKVADNFIEWAYDTKGVEAEGFVERFKQFISDFFEHLRNLIADQSFKQHGEFIANMASVEELTDIQNKVLNAIDNAAKNYRQEAYNNTKAQTEDAGVAASFSVEVGKDGIERYTTSERTKKLTNKERQKELQRLIEEEYVGRTAKFIRNGHAYYATLDRKGMNKNIYGDKKSDSKGYKAKIRIGADGDIFELAENARYTGSSPEHKAKQGGAHRNNQTWDYFEKYIESDGVVFDVLINVRKNNDGEFVYGIELKENKSRMPGRQKSPSVTGIQLNKNIPSSTENSKLSLEVDTEGNKLSEGQKKYFKDSKVVDENGALKVMYHGTDAEFNVFNPSKSDDGLSMFFTDDENIAKGYGNTSKVYINVENPLHVYAENADDFTWQEALGYGLSENEKEEYFNLKNRIDSLENGDEKYALEEKLQNRFYDNLGNKTTKEWSAKAKAEGYDGVIFHDIIDSASEDYYEPSNVVVVFDSNQVKRVDNQNPTDNADIRYSLDLPNYSEEIDDLIFGEELGPFLKKGAELLNNTLVDRKAVERVAKDIIKQTSSEYDATKLADNLEKVFAYMQSGQKVNETDLGNIMLEVAKPVVEESKMINSEEKERYDNFVDYLKTISGVRLSEKQKEEVRNVYGTYGNFRNKFFGKLNISDKASTTLDQIWSELVDMSDGVLELDAAEGDQPTALLETLEALKPSMITPFLGNNNEAAYDLALRIVHNYYDYIEKDIENSEPIKAYKKILRDRALEYRQSVRNRYEERYKEEVAKVKKSKERVSDAILKERARVRDVKKEQAEKQEASHQREQIRKTANLLFNMLEKPTDKRHIPDALRTPITQFLASIDFVSPRAKVDSSTTLKWQDMARKLAEDIKEIEETGMLGKNADRQLSYMKEIIDPDLYDKLKELAKETNIKVSSLSPENLKTLNNCMKALKSAVVKSNEGFGSINIEETAKDTISYLSQKKERIDKVTGNEKVNDAVQWIRDIASLRMLDSISYFETLGPGAKKILKGLQDGFKNKVKRVGEEEIWFENMLKDTGVKMSDLNKWQTKKEFKYTFEAPEGEIELSAAQLMELYAHSKREQSRAHYARGGIRSGAPHASSTVVHITPSLFDEMMSKLTDEQKLIADKMQHYLSSTVAGWGNNASKEAYGYSKFNEKYYWPIKTDSNTRAANDGNTSDNVSLYAIKNKGFSKNTEPDAKQPMIIGNAFITFGNHVAEMATYEGMLIPLQDAMSWYNYSEVVEEPGENGFRFDYGVKQSIERALGKYGQTWFTKFIKDVNGADTSEKAPSFIGGMVGNAKAAVIGANMSVVVQQPTTITRAAMEMNPKYLLQAQPSLFRAKKLADKAQENSMLAKWKHWGYFDAYLGKSMTQVTTGTATTKEKVQDFLAVPAQLADDLTWGVLWQAVEYEIADTTDLIKDTEEFNKAVTERFDYLIDRTQVVDTVFNRSDLMRSTSELTKLATAFKMEPGKSYNMLYRAVNSGDKQKMFRAGSVFLLNALVTAMARGAWVALRDDDDEHTYFERWLASVFGYNGEDTTAKDIMSSDFFGNANPIALLPWASDVFNALMDYDATRMDVGWIYDTVDAGKEIYKYATGASNKTPWGVLEKALKAAGETTGIPFYSIYRDFVKVPWNNITNIDYFKDKGFENIQTKQPGTYDKLKKSIVTGNDIETQVQAVLDKGKEKSDIGSTLSSNYKMEYNALSKATDEESKEDFKELDANLRTAFKAAGYEDEEINTKLDMWAYGDGKSTTVYQPLYDTFENGGDVQAEVKKLMDSGKEKSQVASAITSHYKEKLIETRDPNLKSQLIKAYMAAGYTNSEAKKKIDKWFEPKK